MSFLLLGLSFRLATYEVAIALPEPKLRGMSVEEAIRSRRSIRSYSGDSLSLVQLSQILFAAQGITGKRGDKLLRAAPSAGATYPLEVYVFVGRVRGIASGIYHYVPDTHSLEVLRIGDFTDSLALACLGQSMPREAAISVVLTCVPERTTRIYGERGMRYIYMEAGHVSENICLEAISLGLGAVPVGAFYDEVLNRLIGVDTQKEMAIYVNCIGKPAKRGERK